MKTIGFQDRAGGMVRAYFNKQNPNQKRIERILEGLKELNRTAMIKIFLVDGKKLRLLKVKGY